MLLTMRPRGSSSSVGSKVERMRAVLGGLDRFRPILRQQSGNLHRNQSQMQGVDCKRSSMSLSEVLAIPFL